MLLVRVALLALAVVGVVASWLFLPAPTALAILVGVAVAGLAWLRRQGVGLFGPVFYWDLVRNTRRMGLVNLRTLYLVLLLFILYQVFVATFRQFWPFDVGTASPGDLARFSFGLFFTFLTVQMATLLLVTPATTAGAIAEERERRSLPFLLATDLRDHEIVLGKFAARLVPLLGLVLAGVPVFASLQLLGGIDLGLVAICFAGTLATALSVAGFCTLLSVVFARPRYAILLGVVAVGGALLAPGLIEVALRIYWRGAPAAVVAQLDLLKAGHPYWAMVWIYESGGGQEALGILGRYALIHGAVAVFCLGVAILFVRPCGLSDGEAAPARTKGAAKPRPDRDVGGEPVQWREVWARGGFATRPWFVRLFLLGVLATLALVDTDEYSTGRNYPLNAWCRFLTVGVTGLMLLQVVLRAAGSVRLERDRDTLDTLLTTPLEVDEILGGKWWGAVASMRRLAPALLLVWLIGLVGGGLHPLAVVCQAALVLVYAGGLASYGLWVSVTAGSATRAAILAIVGGLLLSFGHFAIWLCCVPVMLFSRGPGPGDGIGLLVAFELGLTPPIAIGVVGFGWWELEYFGRYHREGGYFLCGAFGAAAWLGIAAYFWALATTRFREKYNRPETPTGPERHPAPPDDAGQ